MKKRQKLVLKTGFQWILFIAACVAGVMAIVTKGLSVGDRISIFVAVSSATLLNVTKLIPTVDKAIDSLPDDPTEVIAVITEPLPPEKIGK